MPPSMRMFKYEIMSSRKPRRCDLGGGVAVLYKNNLDVQRVKQKSKYSTISYEFPKSKGDPYYPINNKLSNREMAPSLSTMPKTLWK